MSSSGRQKSAAVSGSTAAATPGGPLPRVVDQGFGSAPVFLAAISTILGAVLFLRFPYAVGHLGFAGAMGVILLGHAVTIPTALAVAEIATNRRVEGGGEYYIISRSFGTTIGGTIGFWLYMSQAISVAFYMIAFAESFQGLWPWIESWTGLEADPRFISLPAVVLLLAVILRKGAGLGVSMLGVVSAILFVVLLLFFIGGYERAPADQLGGTVADPDPFLRVFAIVFPAFTGMTAGVGLSGNLRNPRRSIPLGTLAGTMAGMAVYAAVVVKLVSSAPAEVLADTDRLVMQDIALWPPIIPIGLAAAAVSSAIGSILVAPRTLQALARDRVFPFGRANAWMAAGEGSDDEPKRATVISGAIAILFVTGGDIDMVSQVITMFFLVTYGTLCLVSFLEHFAGNPSYRPSFRSRWYLSLLGAVMSFMLMFQIQPIYALAAVGLMLVIYYSLVLTRKGERDVAEIIRGVMFQLTRRLHISIQKSRGGAHLGDARPSFVAVACESSEGIAAFDLLRWICHRQGFGQYMTYLKGDFSPPSAEAARQCTDRMIRQTEDSRAEVFVDTIVAPGFQRALSQAVQSPGISGLPNNSVLLDFPAHEPHQIERIVDAVKYLTPLYFHVCVLRTSGKRFGYRSNIHIWLTDEDLQEGDTARLMVLLAYILLGHREWMKADIRIFACFPAEHMEAQTEALRQWISAGRLPISQQNLYEVPYRDREGLADAVRQNSTDADLVFCGLTGGPAERDMAGMLQRFPDIADVLFVRAGRPVPIS